MRLKKVLSALAASVMACSMGIMGAACGGDAGPAWTPPKNTDEYIVPQDYYRTYYEVFVRSFADGNGDGIGDLRGLADNLDYLNDGNDETSSDLGINGIWMMPINSSPSYHKYDVIDYYSIDDEYGTLEDFDYLVRECDKRDIWLQMDLVLNHTSTQHKWFKAAVSAAQQGRSPVTNADMLRYEFVKSATRPLDGTWHKVTGTQDYWYLGNFSSEMPDVRLDNPSVRDEICNIVDFWLDRGIRSFRLDAVPWACENSTVYSEDNAEFWTWFNEYCDEKGAEVFGSENDGIDAYCYNVGEVWADSSTVTSFFGTGMSNFNYAMGGSEAVGFVGAVNERYRASSVSEELERYQKESRALDPDAILSNFLSNHDNDRSAGFLQRDEKKIKRAAGMYLLAPGNAYIYYGEEIGALGSGVDENKRLAFNWGDKRKVKDPLGGVYEGKQEFGSMKSQTNKPDSILSYYREAIKLRNRFPEIARGTVNAYALKADGVLELASVIREGLDASTSLTSVNSDNWTVAAYTLAWKDRKVLVVHNIGNEVANIGLGSAFSGYSVVGSLKASGGDITVADGTLTMSPGTAAVLKAIA